MDKWPEERATATGDALRNAVCAIGAVTSVGLGYGSAQASQLVRYPYLTDVTSSSVTVNFATSALNPAPVVLWGPSGVHRR